jgi:hypothetical protein
LDCVHAGSHRGGAGGIASLLSYLDHEELREALEYDLLTRGIDLGDLYTGEMSIRRYRVLVRGLPDDSRTVAVLRRLARAQKVATTTALEDLPPEYWSNTDWLLWRMEYQVQNLIWHYVCTHLGKGKTRPPAPTPLPHPGGVPKRRKTLNAWFGAVGLKPLEKPRK